MTGRATTAPVVDQLSPETWMPVSGTFRRYPLEIQRLEGIDSAQLYSKGHHDPVDFAIALGEWWFKEYDGPPPARLRFDNVRTQWWATRMWGDAGHDHGYSHFLNPVEPWERGAYPVTVIDL